MQQTDSEQLGLPMQEPTSPEVDWRQKVPSVSQLNRQIRGHLENSFFDVWVRGEISSLRKPSSGHGYFIIKDASAQLKAVMFRGQLSKIAFQIKEGMEILAHGRVTVYEARGDYQIVCDTLEPMGVGALQLAFEQLKLKLHQEGLFDKAKKKPLPFLPKRIGVVTSSTGAAVKDILKVLSRRFPNREVMILPASVQGQKAAGEIVQSISNAQQWNIDHPERAIDVLIVGRGGGSLEDLWPFNEEVVARAIFDCTIPVISAVGHEIDITISDYVADVRAPTPSAAAEIVVPKLEELQFQVQTLRNRSKAAMVKKIEQMRMHVDHISQRLIDPRQLVRQLRQELHKKFQRLKIATKTACLMNRRRLESAVHKLDLLSPLQIIGRGYSITSTPDQRIIRRLNEVNTGDTIVTQVVDGHIYSKVAETRAKQ